jgi:hypothetical protein
MTIKIRGLVSSGNGGDGIRIEGDVHLDAEDVVTEGNGGQGINIIRHAGLLDQLGLPKETDPKALADLLASLRGVPPHAREKVIRESGLLSKLGRGVVDVSTVVNNIVSIAANPVVADIIRRLSSGV